MRALPLVAFALTLASSSRALADGNVQACVSASEDGQRQRREGKLLRAREEFAACSRAECPPIVRNDCATWAGEVVQTLPSVVFAARDASGADLAHVRVLSDGAVLSETLDGKPTDVDPGEHQFRFEADGFLPGDVHVVIRVGEKDRPVAVTLHPVQASATHGSVVAPVLLGGLGLALGAAALVLDLTTTSSADNLRSTCAPSCSSSSVDALRTRYVVAGVLGGAGVVAIGAATVLLLTGRPAWPPPSGAALFFDVQPGARGVSGDVGVRF
jgi:hypothetical protein